MLIRSSFIRYQDDFKSRIEDIYISARFVYFRVRRERPDARAAVTLRSIQRCVWVCATCMLKLYESGPFRARVFPFPRKEGKFENRQWQRIWRTFRQRIPAFSISPRSCGPSRDLRPVEYTVSSNGIPRVKWRLN